MSVEVDPDVFLNDDEAGVVMLAHLLTAVENGRTEEELLRAVDWAAGVRIDQGFLMNVLLGRIVFDTDDSGEYRYFPANDAQRKQLASVCRSLRRCPTCGSFQR